MLSKRTIVDPLSYDPTCIKAGTVVFSVAKSKPSSIVNLTSTDSLTSEELRLLLNKFTELEIDTDQVLEADPMIEILPVKRLTVEFFDAAKAFLAVNDKCLQSMKQFRNR